MYGSSMFRAGYSTAGGVGLLALVALPACGGAGDSDSDSGAALDPVCTEAAAIDCEDAIILDLALQDDKVSDGEVANSQDGADWITTVDATAGGYGNESTHPWVYVKFTENGAERVDINDEDALESMDWDVAARRFILRLNGGSSGPSCVGATPFLQKSYAELTSIPDGTTYYQDDFYTDDCTIINDSSGLPGSPQVAMASWWSYDGCLVTTGHPFLIQRADGRVVKLVVEQYYAEGQEDCNESGTPGQDGATFQWRWTFMNWATPSGGAANSFRSLLRRSRLRSP